MDINKCIKCRYYDSFFGSCSLYFEEIYMGEGDYEQRPVSVRSVSKSECEYEPKGGR